MQIKKEKSKDQKLICFRTRSLWNSERKIISEEIYEITNGTGMNIENGEKDKRRERDRDRKGDGLKEKEDNVRRR